MDDNVKIAPKCPGCHFGCNLERYQCARGKGLYAKWTAGETIPERRAPWERPKPAGDGEHPNQQQPAQAAAPQRPPIPPTMRVMHMMNIVAMAMADHRNDDPRHQVLDTIARHDGCATLAIVKGRLKDAKIDATEAIAQLVEEGLLEQQEDERAGTMYALAKQGAAQAQEWRAEQLARDEEFLDALSDDEKSQLADLVAKMLTSTAHKRRFEQRKP